MTPITKTIIITCIIRKITLPSIIIETVYITILIIEVCFNVTWFYVEIVKWLHFLNNKVLNLLFLPSHSIINIILLLLLMLLNHVMLITQLIIMIIVMIIAIIYYVKFTNMMGAAAICILLLLLLF